jgi:nitrogen fixation protein FixH
LSVWTLSTGLLTWSSPMANEMTGWIFAPAIVIESGFPVSTYNNTAAASYNSPSFTTSGPSLLVAMFGTYHNTVGGTGMASTVTGAGLTWTLQVGGSGDYSGDVEIWTATSSAAISTSSNVTVSFPNATDNDLFSITVLSITGASASPYGVTIARSQDSGANPQVNVTFNGTTAGSLLLLNARDQGGWEFAATAGSGTTIMYQSPAAAYSAYAQHIRNTSPSAGGSVTLSTSGIQGTPLTWTGIEILPPPYNSTTFNGTAATALAASDANWADAEVTDFPVSNYDLDGSGNARCLSEWGAGARYTASTSDISSVVHIGNTATGANTMFSVILRNDGAGTYYRARVYGSGSSWTAATLYSMNAGTENFIAGTAPSIDATVDHTLTFTATGNGASVALDLLVDGVSVISASDTSANRITSVGNPGFTCYGGAGGAANCNIRSWQDY